MKKQTNVNKSWRLFPLLFVLAFLTSCVSNKKIAYFQDIQTVNQASLDSSAKYVEPKIQNDDILTVNIFTLDPESGAIVNQAPATGALNSTSTAATTGYLVDKNGEIELVLLGRIKVAGLTTFEARELISGKVREIYNKASVEVRFANFKVSVFGEVNLPSTYTFPNEKTTILDALSRAGDLTIFGKRDNILIVRDNDGKKEFGRVNLNSTTIFRSPFYYLKQNDAIYIEPNKARVSANNASQVQTIGIISSVLSVLVLAISLFK